MELYPASPAGFCFYEWYNRFTIVFSDRRQAGEMLADKLKKIGTPIAQVFAIPRGGAVVGEEIAKRLDIPLKLLLVKKIGAPKNSELAIGAVAPGGISYIDRVLVGRLSIGQKELAKLTESKRRELAERKEKYKISYQKSLAGKTIIITDDGIATGATVKAAIKYLRLKKAKKIILGAPVVAKDTYDEIKSMVDELIVLEIPESFGAVGQFYRDFPQVNDEEVISILAFSNQRQASS